MHTVLCELVGVLVVRACVHLVSECVLVVLLLLLLICALIKERVERAD